MARNNLDSPAKLKREIRRIKDLLDHDDITPKKAEVLLKVVSTAKDVIKVMELEQEVMQLREMIADIQEREKIRKQSGMY